MHSFLFVFRPIKISAIIITKTPENTSVCPADFRLFFENVKKIVKYATKTAFFSSLRVERAKIGKDKE